MQEICAHPHIFQKKILGLVLKVKNMLFDMISWYTMYPHEQHWSILFISICNAHPCILCKCTSVRLYMNTFHSCCAWILQCISLQFQFQCDQCNWPGWPSTNSVFNQILTFSEIIMWVVLTFYGWLPGCYTVARVVKTVPFHVHLWVL